jgi:hypothetical protein
MADKSTATFKKDSGGSVGSQFAPAIMPTKSTPAKDPSFATQGSEVQGMFARHSAHESAVAAGGFKHHTDDVQAGVKGENKRAQARHDLTHRGKIGGN